MEPVVTTDQDTDTEQPAAAPPVSDGDPGALDALVGKYSARASSGGKAGGIRRRTAEVVITPDMAEPDALDKNISIGIEGLSAKQEMEALKKASDGLSMGFEMAKLSMRSLNGKPMKHHERDLVWEVLGLAGRTAVTNAYLTACSGVQGGGLGNSLGVTVG